MKYKGQHIVSRPKREILAFFQGESKEPIGFVLEAVVDYKEYEERFPTPKPRPMLKAGGERTFDYDNPDFKQSWSQWHTDRINWLILKTLSATPELEWETVDPSDPKTWPNFQNELKEAGFNPAEIEHLKARAITINNIDESMMKQARDRFLVSQGEASVS